LIGLPFALSGFGKLAAIGPTTEIIRAAGLPLPSLALIISIVVQLGGGLLLVAGFRARIVAGVLALFSIAAALSIDNRGAPAAMRH
jgi:putative oxidoreductase